MIWENMDKIMVLFTWRDGYVKVKKKNIYIYMINKKILIY